MTGMMAGATAEVRDSVSLMVSELSTNALVHAASGFDVVVDRSVHSVLVAVSDGGDGTPVLQSPESDEPHGRGLRIVDTLSDEWGISSTSAAGKTVWFRMSLESSGVGASADGTADPTTTGTEARVDLPSARPAPSVTQPEGTQGARLSSRDERPGRWSRVRSTPSTPGHHRRRSVRSPAGA